jgi:hypothetical protein
MLREDLTETSAMLLHRISLQLSNASVETLPQVALSSYEAPASAIRVNTLWFLSLVLSLAAALFGILLKGWMRAYMRWTSISPPQDAVGLRQYRFEGLQRWKLPLVLAILPGLLQLALLFFLCGLLDFLWHLHTIVAAIVGMFTVVSLTLALCTMIIPVFSRSSPFRSPIARMLLRTRATVTSTVLRAYLSVTHYIKSAWSFQIALPLLRTAEFWRHKSWEELDLRGMKASDALSMHPTGCDARVRALHHLYTSVTDEVVLEQVRPCLYEPTTQGNTSLPMFNCWPIASALLGFEDTIVFDRAVQHLEIPSARAYDMGMAATVKLLRTTNSTAGFSIYNRAMAMPPRIKRFLSTLILESASSEAGPSRGKVLLKAMYLLPLLIAGDATLIRRYIMMLAPLMVEEGSDDIRSLACVHFQIAASHLNQDEATWELEGTIFTSRITSAG